MDDAEAVLSGSTLQVVGRLPIVDSLKDGCTAGWLVAADHIVCVPTYPTRQQHG